MPAVAAYSPWLATPALIQVNTEAPMAVIGAVTPDLYRGPPSARVNLAEHFGNACPAGPRFFAPSTLRENSFD